MNTVKKYGFAAGIAGLLLLLPLSVDAAGPRGGAVTPDFQVSTTCFEGIAPGGSSVNFRIQVTNLGGVPMEVRVWDPLLALDVTLLLPAGTGFAACPEGVSSGGCLVFEVPLFEAEASSVYHEVVVTGRGQVPDGTPFVLERRADSVCPNTPGPGLGGSATRGPGFWKSHPDFTAHLWSAHGVGPLSFGWRWLDNTAELLGLFWANPTWETTGGRRSALCKARVCASTQAAAALLSNRLGNGAPLPRPWEDVMAVLNGFDVSAINALAAEMEAHNESGEGVAILDREGYPVEPADPQGSFEAASPAAVDCVIYLPPPAPPPPFPWKRP